MKNNQCTILLSTKSGYTQTYRKNPAGWTQTLPDGTVRRMTAEQLLSHLLPPLAFGNIVVTVKPDRKKRLPLHTSAKRIPPASSHCKAVPSKDP